MLPFENLKNIWRIKNGACRFPHRFRSRQHNPAAGAAPCPNTSHARCNSASAPRACCGRNTAGRAQAKPGLRKTPLFFEFSLCLSRACLGKMIVYMYKWRKKSLSFTQLSFVLVEQVRTNTH